MINVRDDGDIADAGTQKGSFVIWCVVPLYYAEDELGAVGKKRFVSGRAFRRATTACKARSALAAAIMTAAEARCYGCPALVRELYYRHVPELWDRCVFISAIAILWYWVALNVESWRRDRKVLAFSWLPLRLTADLLLIALGVFWGVVFTTQGRLIHADLELSSPLLAFPVLGLLLAWSLALVFFFGRDLIHCVRERRRA
jgi:hypothetical protein